MSEVPLYNQERAWLRLGRAAAGLLALLVLTLVLVRLWPEWLAGGRALQPQARLAPPAPDLWLGRDGLGRDLAARLCIAAPNSLLLAAAAALLAVVPGAILGALAALWRPLDAVLMRLADALLTLPPLVLALALLTLIGPGATGLVLALAIPELPRVMRFVCVLSRSLTQEPWYQAARGFALPPHRLVFSQLLPALAAPLAVVFAQVAAIALLVESLLGFLGLGLPADAPGWGSMLAEGRGLLRSAPHLVLAPGLCIAATIFCLQVLADSLRARLERTHFEHGEAES